MSAFRLIGFVLIAASLINAGRAFMGGEFWWLDMIFAILFMPLGIHALRSEPRRRF